MNTERKKREGRKEEWENKKVRKKKPLKEHWMKK